MSRFPYYVSLMLPFCASVIFAASGPKIEFDVKAFQCGTIIEGKTEKLNAVFNVKNTGDALLKLESVRPGCGCTVVKYDSLIQPGKTAKIEAQVNIKGYRSGSITKSITVTSNAEKDHVVQLTIEATIKSAVDISGTYINLIASDGSTPRTMYLTSKKPDLKVLAISFKSRDDSGAPLWLSGQANPVKFTCAPLDSTTADGSRVFKLDIYPPSIAKAVTGDFTITTNHPEKPEINLPGTINK
jgi:hypothetical protein